jgi:RecG-like helicase
MREYGVSDYYASRLEKIGFDFYKLLTYLPFRLETISPNIYSQADMYFVNSKILNVINKGKYDLVTVMYKNNEINIFDFAKKTKFINNFENKVYQFLFTKSNTYYTLQEINPKESDVVNHFELGKLGDKIYYRTIYPQISFQIRTKQISKIHSNIKDQFYKLNLKGLIPNSPYLDQIIDLRQLHKPNSIEEYNMTLKKWNMFQGFLNLVFLNSLSQTTPTQETLLTEYPSNFITDFENNHNLELSDSQKIAINTILNNITYKK